MFRLGSFKSLLVTAMLILPSAATADSIKEFWAKTADREHFQTAKSSLALEMCIGMEMSDWLGPPGVLHGEGQTIITVPGPIGGARILDHGTSREVIVGAKPAWKGRMADAVRRCI